MISSNNVPKISCVYMRNISWNQVNREVHSHGLTDVHFCLFFWSQTDKLTCRV